jgi:putative transposase
MVFEDEASISNTATVSYKWEIKGKQPLIKTKQSKRERQTFFGCVAPTTGEVVAKRANRGNAQTFKSFLKKVIRRFKNKKVIMVLDNVRYHHAKVLRPFLEENKSKIELLFLPPYSPDLNPMERVWWYMRKKITHNRYTASLNDRIKFFWQLFSSFTKPNDFIPKLCNINLSD